MKIRATYLVFGSIGENGTVQTDICTRTSPISSPWAAQDLLVLNGEPTKPVSQAPAVGIGLGLTAVLALFILFKRRYR